MLGAFPRQPMDFFGAVKSRLADEAVRGWLEGHGAVSGRAQALLLFSTPPLYGMPLALGAARTGGPCMGPCQGSPPAGWGFGECYSPFKISAALHVTVAAAAAEQAAVAAPARPHAHRAHAASSPPTHTPATPAFPPQGADAALSSIMQQRLRGGFGGSGGRNGGGGGGGVRLEPAATLEAVLAAGRDLAGEQQAVMDVQLAKQVGRPQVARRAAAATVCLTANVG